MKKNENVQYNIRFSFLTTEKTEEILTMTMTMDDDERTMTNYSLRSSASSLVNASRSFNRRCPRGEVIKLQRH